MSKVIPMSKEATEKRQANLRESIKKLANLKESIMAGAHVCAPDEDGTTVYVFYDKDSERFIEARSNNDDVFVEYIILIKEGEANYYPHDYENVLNNASGPYLQPIWSICIIPEELMTRFLAKIDERGCELCSGPFDEKDSPHPGHKHFTCETCKKVCCWKCLHIVSGGSYIGYKCPDCGQAWDKEYQELFAYKNTLEHLQSEVDRGEVLWMVLDNVCTYFVYKHPNKNEYCFFVSSPQGNTLYTDPEYTGLIRQIGLFNDSLDCDLACGSVWSIHPENLLRCCYCGLPGDDGEIENGLCPSCSPPWYRNSERHTTKVDHPYVIPCGGLAGLKLSDLYRLRALVADIAHTPHEAEVLMKVLASTDWGTVFREKDYFDDRPF